ESYAVGPNDTLAGIAQAVYGDASLWYLIGDANSLRYGPGEPLPSSEVGHVYRIPRVINGRNNAATFEPYNIGSAMGSGIPTAAPPAGPGCADTTWQIAKVVLVVAAAAVVTAYTGGAAGALVGNLAGGVIGALAGSAVGQELNMQFGFQDG